MRVRAIIPEGPCPPCHHHRFILSSATLLTSQMLLPKIRPACWRCWPAPLIPGTGGGCATGWQ